MESDTCSAITLPCLPHRVLSSISRLVSAFGAITVTQRENTTYIHKLQCAIEPMRDDDEGPAPRHAPAARGPLCALRRERYVRVGCSATLREARSNIR